MGFFELVGIAVFLYYLVYLILWLILDTDVELFIKEKTGKPISALRGQVVWVTGASSGIGKHLALALAKHGVRLCLAARREVELEQVKKECLSASNNQLNPDDVLVLKMDLLQFNNHQTYFNKVLAHFGHIDVLVNNAGRSQRANWQDIDIQVDRELFELDVFSVVNLTRIYVNYLLNSNKRGHVAVTSSVAGLIAVPGSCSYVGAKFAIQGYFESLKAEQPDIDVSIFCPGPTTTEFLQQAFTNKPGEVYNENAKSSAKRMTAERCGYLIAIALANKLSLSFVGPFPICLLTNISLYYPNLKTLMMKAIGARQIKNLRDPEKKKN